MKRLKWIALIAILFLLFPTTLSASESVDITTTVPDSYAITVTGGTSGTYRVDGKSYSGQNIFIVKRFGNFVVEAVPNIGYLVEVTVGGKLQKSTGDNTWSLTDLLTNKTMNVKFVPDPKFKLSLIPPESRVLGEGKSTTLDAQAFGYEPMQFLWEVSADDGHTWKIAPGTNDKASYKITNAQENPNGMNMKYIYRLTVTDGEKVQESCTCDVLVMDAYLYRTVKHTEDTISISSYMHNDTHLKIVYLDHSESDATKIMGSLDDNRLPLLICDVNLVNDDGEILAYFGDLLLEFYVGESYNGQTLRVFHMHDSGIKMHLGYVEDGYLTILADSLSVFMVEVPMDSVYQITVNPCEHGEISPAGIVYAGIDANILFEFEPNFGYYVSKLLVNDVAVDVTHNHFLMENVTQDSTIEVTFARHKGDHAFWLTVVICLVLIVHLMGVINKKGKRHRQRTSKIL